MFSIEGNGRPTSFGLEEVDRLQGNWCCSWIHRGLRYVDAKFSCWWVDCKLWVLLVVWGIKFGCRLQVIQGPVGLICIGEFQVKLINYIFFASNHRIAKCVALSYDTNTIAGTGTVFINNFFSAYQSRGFYSFLKSEKWAH